MDIGIRDIAHDDYGGTELLMSCGCAVAIEEDTGIIRGIMPANACPCAPHRSIPGDRREARRLYAAAFAKELLG